MSGEVSRPTTVPSRVFSHAKNHVPDEHIPARLYSARPPRPDRRDRAHWLARWRRYASSAPGSGVTDRHGLKIRPSEARVRKTLPHPYFHIKGAGSAQEYTDNAMTDAGEIIKSGAGEKIADLVNKLAGPLAEEVGMMLGDKVKVYRVKNWIKTAEKTER